METLKIDIINPKAKSILQDLADLKLIRIQKHQTGTDFRQLLEKLRMNSSDAPAFEEITKEVEAVRSSRYEK